MSNEIVKRNHKRKLLILLAMLLTPVLASYALYFSDFRPGSVNYGELIEIKAVKGSGVNQLDSTILRMRDMRGKWVMLMVDSGSCDEACQQKIYHMRQVRLVQHKEKNRVERIWLIDDNEAVEPALVEDYEGTLFINARGSDLLAFIQDGESPRNHIYLIDPIGNLMMRFPENADPSLMVKDVKRLLHVSQLEH